MKIKILLLLLIPTFLLSQKYFLLDSLKNYNIKEYTLETKEIYNIEKQINVYNVYITKNNILLISVLPDLEKNILSNLNYKDKNWVLINYEDFKNQIFSSEKLIQLASEWSTSNTPEKKTMEYKIIKKEKDSYYISKYCLTEFFKISNLEQPLISKYGVINILDTKLTIKQMQDSFKKQFPNTQFILDIRTDNFLYDSDVAYSTRNYLSKKVNIKKDIGYQFWTFDGWWVQDGYNVYRGIDRFLYIPNKGIVGGSYDFYFKLKPKISTDDYYTISNDKLWENIIDEKIMFAKELK